MTALHQPFHIACLYDNGCYKEKNARKNMILYISQVHTLLCNKLRHYTGFSRAEWSTPTSTTQYTTVTQRSPKGNRDGARIPAEKDYIALQKVNSESQNLAPNGNVAVYN